MTKCDPEKRERKKRLSTPSCSSGGRQSTVPFGRWLGLEEKRRRRPLRLERRREKAVERGGRGKTREGGGRLPLKIQ